ncbi:hypothetical protein RMATCC62417_09702 [Rhizopus microsporus]|nr:hypothetical protein RMATCC62417_09702 [Rhizopus microsporus]
MHKTEFNARIRSMKEKLSTERSRAHLKRKRLSTSSNRAKEEHGVRIITQDASKCMDKVENMKIDNALLKSGKITFSGTDNDLVTMTETVGFDMKRFKFHLDLYNKYSALESLSEEGNVYTDIMDHTVTNIMLNHYISEQETSESTIQMSSYMQLPKPYMAHGSEVDYKNGAKKYRKQLERVKNTTDIGRKVMETEALLSKFDTTSARNLEHKHIIRNCYYSPSRLKQKRAYELQTRKYTNRLCSDERRYATSSRKVMPIMFVGDCGLGIDSRIKGYMRYGGHWKPLKHSLYTSVCITNEHNTSQTCIYCFQKLPHPVQTVYEQSVARLSVTTQVMSLFKQKML